MGSEARQEIHKADSSFLMPGGGSWKGHKAGEMKVSTSTVAALFSKIALTGQIMAMVDMVFLAFTALPYLP